jgi:hypothetical protein
MTKEYDLQDRFIDYAVRIIKLTEAMAETKAGKHVSTQILRSGTSPALNIGYSLLAIGNCNQKTHIPKKHDPMKTTQLLLTALFLCGGAVIRGISNIQQGISNDQGKRIRYAKLLALALLAASSVRAEEAVDLRTTPQIEHSIFGTCTHFPHWHDSEKVIPMVEEAGFKWIRNGVSWALVEKEKGVLEIPPEQMAWIEEAHKRGFKLCMPLVYFNDKLYPQDDWQALCEAYARYCVFMVGKLKGKVLVWEMWNEPALFFHKRSKFGGSWNAKEGAETEWLQKFVEMIVVAMKAIKADHPDATLVAGDIILPVNFVMLDMLKEAGAIGLLDGIVLHPYTHRLPPEQLPWGGQRMDERDGMTVIDDDHAYSSAVRRIREKMREVGMKTDDIYVTEYGFFTQLHTKEQADAQNMGLNLETQAKYLARMALLHKALGAKLAIQYNFQNNDVPYKSEHPEGNVGLIFGADRDYEKKPAYFVMQRINSLFAGPVETFQPDWEVAVDPPGYVNNRKWPFSPPFTTWDGTPIKALDKVLTYAFRNTETGEVLLAVWNAVVPGPRSNLQANITLGTDAFSKIEGIDLMTGKAFDVEAVFGKNTTLLKAVEIPDYPIVIRMKPVPPASQP